MSRRKDNVKALIYAMMVITMPHANAIIISDDVFKSNGGNLKDIPGTIAKAMEPLRMASLQPQFFSVGRIVTGGVACTATWIGDAADSKSVYVLTAAHCTDGKQQKGMQHFEFIDYSGGVTAAGEGTYNISPYRFDKKMTISSAGTDIALIKLPKIADICDSLMVKIPQPIIYDGEDDLNKEVWLTGYGSWGTGTGDSNGSYGPQFGSRRAAGAATVTDIWENGYDIIAGFAPHDGRSNMHVPKWARIASGDSGSAWWQKHQGVWTIIADSEAGSALRSHGTRIAKYADFIKSVYPQARFLSQASRLSDSASRNTMSICLRQHGMKQ